MNEFDQYEKDCKHIRKENKKLLADFEKELNKSKKSSKTIKKHVMNIDMYLNNFLLYYDAKSAAKGVTEIGDYLGDFFIRKCMWSSPEQTKQNVTSFRKFYAYMNSIGKVTDEELKQMQFEIKTFLPEWVEAIRAYNDYDEDEW